MTGNFVFLLPPFASNLEKAYQAVLPILGESATFKCLTLDSESILSLPLYWDGVFADIEGAPTDRDQRGKEICVYMHALSGGQFEKTPEEWKDLLLRCWKALQDAGVEGIGYHHVYGEHLVPTQRGIRSPFTYTASKPYTDRHGILHKANPNEENYPDPLAGIELTYQDLIAYEIDATAVKRSRLESLEMTGSHVKRAERQLAKIVTALSTSPEEGAGSQSLTTLIDELTQLHDSITHDNAATLLREKAHLFEQAQHFWPRESKSSLAINPYFEALNQSLKSEITADSVADIKKIISALTRFANEEKAKIAEDLAALAELFNNSPAFAINPELIDTQAYAIQKLYRQLIHFHHEKTMLLEETKQYICDAASALSTQFKLNKKDEATCLEEFKRFIFHITSVTSISLVELVSTINDLTFENASFMYESSQVRSASSRFSEVRHTRTEEADEFIRNLPEGEKPRSVASASM